jgi:osmotically-inducible protein OsmY
MKRPNNLIEGDVRDELDWDPLLDPSQVTVKASDGCVTLTGAVDTYSEWLEASADARSVKGVMDVDNELLVGLVGEAIVDGDIAASCCDALDADRFVPHGAVTVDVVGGCVTLGGRVNHHFERMAAKHAVEHVDGVKGLTDDIELSPDPIPSDIANRITKALGRKAVLDDSIIKVSNDGQTIYLDGTTDSLTAMDVAEDTAWSAPGVADVVDRLVVVP